MSSVNPRSDQRGIALITAMLVVFLATFAASDLAYRVQLAINRTAVVLGQRQALYYAIGVEQWAAEILRRDAEDSETDHGQEGWAKPFAELPIEGGKITGYISDQQGRFDLNGLIGNQGAVDEAQFERLLTLLRSVGVDENIGAAVVDWIDTDENETVDKGNGAESLYYMTSKPPYRAANGPMAHISELRLVKGMDAEMFAALEPHLTVLPVATGPEAAGINVNAATVPVLMALSPELGEADAKALQEEAANAAFDSVEAFLSHSAVSGLALDAAGLTVASRFFSVHAEVETEYGYARIDSLIERVPDGPVRVVRRELGGPV
jgi:general secretion pathway protein K